MGTSIQWAIISSLLYSSPPSVVPPCVQLEVDFPYYPVSALDNSKTTVTMPISIIHSIISRLPKFLINFSNALLANFQFISAFECAFVLSKTFSTFHRNISSATYRNKSQLPEYHTSPHIHIFIGWIYGNRVKRGRGI